jgi:hypothetical protein
MQLIIKIFEAVGGLCLYTLTALKFIGAFFLVGGIVLFVPFFFLYYTLGYDLFGMVALAGKFFDWGITAVMLGISLLILPLSWVVHDIQQDPVILGVFLLAGCLWLGVKILKSYSRHLNKN